MVHDEALPRGFWKLGRIQSVIVGRDRQARAATVKLMSKNGQSTITLNRPLQRLYPLEIKYEPPDTASTDPSNHELPSQDSPDPQLQSQDSPDPQLQSQDPPDPRIQSRRPRRAVQSGVKNSARCG